AKIRRNYVLSRMHTLGFIGKQIYDAAISTPVSAQPHSPVVELQAPYVGEMVRAAMVSRFGDAAYIKGLRVHTTISNSLQRAANEALRNGLMAYDKRHGYRGPLKHFDLSPDGEIPSLDKLFAPYRTIEGLRIGLVGKVMDQQAEVYLDDGQKATLEWEGMAWARAYINDNQIGPKPKTAEQILRPGDLIRVFQTSQDIWRLGQIPQVSGALISLSPQDGAILALVGGFDFYQSKFNRATQARRQPGSNFKPFVYSAALEKGYTPATIINDAPVVFSDAALEDTWRPENYSGKFYGPTRLRTALSKSRNLVSIRLLHGIGTRYAIDYISRFGFDREKLPNNLSLALGSGAITPLQLISGYTIFANGGFRVTPHLISSIKTTEGQVLFEASPDIACEEPCQTADSDTKAIKNTNINLAEHSVSSPKYAPRVISAPIAYQIVSMMKDVIRTGTARKAQKLGRSDLAGKTGTTNDQRDAWFSGFNADVATTVWVGFDQHKPLGNRETGGKAALPVWIDYMRIALKGRQERSLKQPEGMLTMRIDPQTGMLAGTDNPQGIFETFRAEFAPARSYFEVSQTTDTSSAPSVDIPEQLF
ncbi:MAG: penicillin-binding transpeptidase domain-containing protein, partial [Pseudomonadota bacterium]